MYYARVTFCEADGTLREIIAPEERNGANYYECPLYADTLWFDSDILSETFFEEDSYGCNTEYLI